MTVIEGRVTTTDRSDVYELLFCQKYAINRHRSAPLFKEREAYARHLIARGNTRSSVRCTASYLLHVLRLVQPTANRMVSDAEVKAAAMVWAKEDLKHRRSRPSNKSIMGFSTTARGFFRFHDKFQTSSCFKGCDDRFASHLLLSLQEAGYAGTTITGTMAPVRSFLSWVTAKHRRLLSIRPDDIVSYLLEGRDRGWRSCTTVAHCRALRTFFRFAESRGWCKPRLSLSIRSPIVSRHDWEVIGPPWKDVRRMIDRIPNRNAYECRAKAILLLCSIYGLRNTEVTRLRLEDFDWHGETFSVKRLKRGPWQQFPLQFEVGVAVIRYVRYFRPSSSSPNVFLTMVPPFGPLKNLASIVQKQMKIAGIISQHYGSHSLRHSCASELLRQGSSLQQIAAFLGHRDIRSVSVYAKSDVRSLQEVASFSLTGVV